MQTKEQIFQEVNDFLESLSIKIKEIDTSRPWGGFFVIEESDATVFIEKFFPEVEKAQLNKGKLSPKILIVAPQKKLSWQYHFRRAEIWKLIKGESAIIRSESDIEGDIQKMKNGEIVNLKQGERHRLIGLEEWGIVAEIWMHTDPNHPSDEDDIVRINDDFGRK
jgi:mannose-6-phosphate isomerase-like protein (cupin superfamily)